MKEILIERPFYTRPKKLASGAVHWYWGVPGRIKDAGFEPASKNLGPDPINAFAEVNDVLLPSLREFLSGATALCVPNTPVPGTVDELVHVYKTDPRSTFLTNRAPRSQEDADKQLAYGANHVLRAGPYQGLRFGSLKVEQVTPTEARQLREEYETVEYTEIDPETGTSSVKVRKRATTAKHVFEAFRAAFTATVGIYKKTPAVNPFAKMRFKRHLRIKTYKADLEGLLCAITAAERLGLPNIGTMLLTAYDLQIRVQSIPTRLMVEHYKPADRPDQMLITQWKTNESTWIHLHDKEGNSLYAALEARLDRCKGDRTTGILIPKDGTVDDAWSKGNGPPSRFYTQLREILTSGGLPKACKFTSFRHGGITESAEAGLSESEIMLLSGHRQVQTVRTYIQGTRRGRERARKKVLVGRDEELTRLAAKMEHQTLRKAIGSKS